MVLSQDCSLKEKVRMKTIFNRNVVFQLKTVCFLNAFSHCWQFLHIFSLPRSDWQCLKGIDPGLLLLTMGIQRDTDIATEFFLQQAGKSDLRTKKC